MQTFGLPRRITRGTALASRPCDAEHSEAAPRRDAVRRWRGARRRGLSAAANGRPPWSRRSDGCPRTTRCGARPRSPSCSDATGTRYGTCPTTTSTTSTDGSTPSPTRLTPSDRTKHSTDTPPPSTLPDTQPKTPLRLICSEPGHSIATPRSSRYYGHQGAVVSCNPKKLGRQPWGSHCLVSCWPAQIDPEKRHQPPPAAESRFIPKQTLRGRNRMSGKAKAEAEFDVRAAARVPGDAGTLFPEAIISP